MKYILFCKNSYSFEILSPFINEFKKNNYNWLWYIDKKIKNYFPHNDQNYTTKISDLILYNSDVIIVPGNEVPHYLRGVKVQIFHGFAGEKKGHFRVRGYFDLYLTQGPYFTKKFNLLKKKYKNFEVSQTGWSKLDTLFKKSEENDNLKTKLLNSFKAKKIILYAPTFSPKLTSFEYIIPEIKKISLVNKHYLFLIKLHPLMDPKHIVMCEKISKEISNIIFIKDKGVLKSLNISDLLISDTSSVIYEFLLLNKPVITFKNISDNILWENFSDEEKLYKLIKNNLNKDPFKSERKLIFENYHPFNDGKSVKRILKSIQDYITNYGVPVKRNISFYRKIKIYLKFGFFLNYFKS